MQRDQDDVDDSAAVGEIERLLAEITDLDLQRQEPPIGLWARIETATAAVPDSSVPGSRTGPKEPPQRATTAGPVVEYRIDADDVVVEVGRAWADFARDNDAPEVAVPSLDRTLWSYFDGEAVREPWRLLVERVRASQLPARVPLRCDGPGARRWFDLTVTPKPDGAVHFRAELVFEEERLAVPLLDRRISRDDGLSPVPLCSWCGRGRHGTDWLDVEELLRATRLLEQSPVPPVSQGICQSCRGEMSALLVLDQP